MDVDASHRPARRGNAAPASPLLLDRTVDTVVSSEDTFAWNATSLANASLGEPVS